MPSISNTPTTLPSSDITSESTYMNRRQFIQGLAGSALALSLQSHAQNSPASSLYLPEKEAANTPAWLSHKIQLRTKASGIIPDVLTPYTQVTNYNNFYEFGLDKSDPAKYEHRFNPHPWSVEISGEVEKKGVYQLEDFIKPHTLEDRIYRFRCVEAWSMVIPWLGFPLKAIIDRVKPNSKAKYIAFTTLVDEEQFPGQSTDDLPWPYIEGLRIDEAANPLTLMAVGVYGRALPAQNGAPLRLIVPWKYGFKSIKSIVKIEFVSKQPATTWNQLAAQEYGFYANVNPKVNHPRWSQQRERRLPNSLFNPNWKETLPFNGYANEVASLYTGMNLQRYF